MSSHIRIPECLQDFKDLIIDLSHDAHLLLPLSEPVDKFAWTLPHVHKFKLSKSQVSALILLFPEMKIEFNARIRFSQHVWKMYIKEDVEIDAFLQQDVLKESKAV